MDEVGQKCIEILYATNDGNDLSPKELLLLQGAINDRLPVEGWGRFRELYQVVVEGA